MFFEGKFQENKDWNYLTRRRRFLCQRSSRASSKKTRIETKGLEVRHYNGNNFEGKFQENKDWNRDIAKEYDLQLIFEGKFQENKDWNPNTQSAVKVAAPSFEGKFQENKDWNIFFWHWCIYFVV